MQARFSPLLRLPPSTCITTVSIHTTAATTIVYPLLPRSGCSVCMATDTPGCRNGYVAASTPTLPAAAYGVVLRSLHFPAVVSVGVILSTARRVSPLMWPLAVVNKEIRGNGGCLQQQLSMIPGETQRQPRHAGF